MRRVAESRAHAGSGLPAGCSQLEDGVLKGAGRLMGIRVAFAGGGVFGRGEFWFCYVSGENGLGSGLAHGVFVAIMSTPSALGMADPG